MTRLPLEVNALTVVAIYKGRDGGLYIGADSQWTDSTGLKNFKTKLTVVNGQDNVLVWATAGNPQIGVIEFGEWVRSHQRVESETWQAFIEAAAEEFARLNETRKRIGKAAGEDLDSDDFKNRNLCEMLICGRLSGAIGAYGVSQDGTFQSIEILDTFLSIGTGGPYAEAVLRTQAYLESKRDFKQTDEEYFGNIMALTSQYAKNCNLPFEFIKLTVEELIQYRSREAEPGVEQKPA